MNQRAEETLIEGIRPLPPDRRVQVVDLVEEITDTEIQEIVDLVREVRSERRARSKLLVSIATWGRPDTP